METAAQSAEPEIAEELLHYFVDNGERECFAASLYTCYDLIKPDVAMEVGSVDQQHGCSHCSLNLSWFFYGRLGCAWCACAAHRCMLL